MYITKYIMPTTVHDVDAIEKVYDKINEVLSMPKAG